VLIIAGHAAKEEAVGSGWTGRYAAAVDGTCRPFVCLTESCGLTLCAAPHPAARIKADAERDAEIDKLQATAEIDAASAKRLKTLVRRREKEAAQREEDMQVRLELAYKDLEEARQVRAPCLCDPARPPAPAG
jgi:hypothetical protein